jgi:hypothetical protein
MRGISPKTSPPPYKEWCGGEVFNHPNFQVRGTLRCPPRMSTDTRLPLRGARSASTLPHQGLRVKNFNVVKKDIEPSSLSHHLALMSKTIKFMIALLSSLVLFALWLNYKSYKDAETSREIIEKANQAWHDTYQKGMKKAKDDYDKSVAEIKRKSDSRKYSAELARKYGTEDTWNSEEYDKRREQELRDELQREQLEELRKIREKLEQ